MSDSSDVVFIDDKYLSLLADPCFKSGGATKQVAAWVEGLTALGVNVQVLGAHSNAQSLGDYKHVSITYDPEQGIPKLRYLYVRMPGMLRALVRSGAKYVYHGIPSPYAGVIAICSRFLGKRFILRVSNDFFTDHRAREQFDWFRYAWFRSGFRLADYILCQNDYQYHRLSTRYPGKVAKIGNPYLGERPEKVVPFDKRKHVAWIGIFQRQKNLPLLLEIARRLEDIEFRVAGGNDKALKKEDEHALRDLAELPNVRLVGFLTKEKVLDLLDSSHLLLNTSHYEGFSNTFLEAFSRGTPVFTLPWNDPDGIIQRHKLGDVFTDAETAVRKVRDFCAKPTLFDERSENCLRYMDNHHDLGRQTMEFLRIIEWRSEAFVEVPGKA